MFKQLLTFVTLTISTLLSFNATAAGNMGLMIMDAQARAMPPGAKNSAAYFTLMNHKQEAISLISAKSDVSKVTEFHNHLMIDGAMSMRKVPSIDVAAGESLDFQPGGFHVMLIGLTKNLKPGEQVSIQLNLANGESMIVKADIVMPDEIKMPSTSGKHDKHSMNH
ncbi:hypothetical protein MED121_10130 [Marinomonas sp. MED121]|uniref:copper chaperone PCu(A)C n=1 Tax=Marinomonas sp. MED121 TaxID=314277 RepID=UPI000068FB20|nr:copper chaperone PCu(A)C [Marinomonas sp. MED121]EAQ65070.1 hypothetical protein MED121_10130 [Marinomonas sp. MED121]